MTCASLPPVICSAPRNTTTGRTPFAARSSMIFPAGTSIENASMKKSFVVSSTMPRTNGAFAVQRPRMTLSAA
jgi:hypothetical protein